VSKRGSSVLLRLTVCSLAAVLGIAGLAACDPGPPQQSPIRVNFAPQGETPPSGYVLDSGEAYSSTTGRGWISQTDSTPVSIVGNARDRDKVTDQRLDTFIHMQFTGDTGGVATPARWEAAVQNGVYDVTVAVGDVSTVTGSTHRITVENTTVINNFVPTTANRTATVTERLRITDGKVTLDAAGGTNTKLDYVDIVPVTGVVSAGTTIARINFAAASNAVPHRYSNDTGSAYTAARGYGWISQTDSTPMSIVGDGRDRNNATIGDQRVDTFVAMQNTDSTFGPTTPARWQYGVASGSYDVTVSVGDANTAAGSTHRIAVEDTVAIDNFTPTASNKFKVATVRVTVSDGFLTLDAAGGTNTKINYVDIVAADTNARTITSVDPSNGQTNVPLDSSVALSPSAAVNPDTVNANTVQLLDPSNVQVDGVYNSDAAGGVVIFTPGQDLLPNTTYTVQTTSGLKDTDGNPYAPFTSTFTTGTSSAPPSPVNFDKSTQADLTGPTSMVIGPDGKLYVGNGVGEIRRYPILAGGALGTPDVISPFGVNSFSRTITGLAFQPGSTPSNLRLWVSHGALGNRNMANFTGKVTLLTGANLDTVQDKITGLPRSVKDHMNNGIVFGPDGRLYLAQGAMNGYGGPDQNWGYRAETPMSASILVADVVNDPAFGGTKTVNVNTDNGYDPNALGAPVKVYAQGTRNPFDLVWANDGQLYAPVNESSAGDTPAGPNGNDPVPLSDLPAGRDYLAKITQGKYYGHPNPAQGHYVLNGGNPTAAADPFETPQYPVGTQPDPNYQQPLLDLGLHRSADGIDQYTSNVFGSTLRNKLLIAEYSNGDDIIAVDPANPTDKFQIASGLYNPLDVRADPATGNVYVAEYGSDPEGTGGHITLLTPAPDSTRTPYARVDFTTKTAAVPTGYNRDSGQGYNASRGFGWVAPGTQTPADLTAQSRERNLNSNKLVDTFIQMQQTPPGDWQLAVPNGTYDVTVGVGDAGAAVDSTHSVSAESTVVVPPFTPTSGDKFRTATARVDVSDGFLTLSAAGGTNTKIDYVDVDTITSTGTPPADTTNPNVELTTTGTGTPPNYTSAVSVSATATDIGTGVSSVTYTLDGGTPAPYTGPISVATQGNHSVVVTAKDGANNTGSATSNFTITPAAGSPALTATGEADVLGLGSRIIFSTARKAATPAKAITITNTGGSNLVVSNLALSGTNPAQFALNTGQATSFTVAPGASANVSVLFKPNSIGVKFAILTITSNDPLVPNYTVALRGVNANGTAGDTEPTLTDLMNTFGFSTNTGITDVFQATTRSPVGDEVIAPNFVRADSSKPVSMLPIARYVAASTFTSDTGRTAKNSNARTVMYKFPADTVDNNPDDGVDTTVFAQNQKVFPQISPGGTTTFNPTAPFGLALNYANYSDDQFNIAQDGSGYRFHNVRVWPAKGPNGVQIPNTWLVGVDVNTTNDKNFDYQDQLVLLSNAQPELTAAVGPNTPATTLSFNSPTAGTIVDKDGEGTGFTSVQANTAGTQYKKSLIDLTGGRLRLTSTAGKNSGQSNDQNNALQLAFDASRSNFTEQTRIINPTSGLTAGFQQKSMYFGPDQDNYLKMEIEHRTDTPGIFITVFLEQAHVTSTIGQVKLTDPPANYLSLDFQITGNLETGTLQAAYRVNSTTGAYTALGTAFQPANIFQWFSPQARAGVLVSNTGTTTTIVGVYDSFQVI